MLNQQQLTHLDETIRRLIVEIGRRVDGELANTEETLKAIANVLVTLVELKNTHQSQHLASSTNPF